MVSFGPFSVKVPTHHSRPWRGETSFRSQDFSSSQITRLNPYSVEFDNSIDWKHPIFARTPSTLVGDPSIFDWYTGDNISNLAKNSLKAARSETLLKQLDFNSFVSTHKNRLNTGKLVGRHVERNERSWRLIGFLPKNTIKLTFSSVLAVSASSDSIDCPVSGQFSMLVTSGRVSRNYRELTRSLTDMYHRLINVFEIRGAANGDTHVCLSFLTGYISDFGKPNAHIVHIWISISKRGLENPDFSSLNLDTLYESLPYVYGGLPLLMEKVFLLASGYDPSSDTFTIERGDVSFKIPKNTMLERMYRNFTFNLPQKALTWGTSVSLQNSFTFNESQLFMNCFCANSETHPDERRERLLALPGMEDLGKLITYYNPPVTPLIGYESIFAGAQAFLKEDPLLSKKIGDEVFRRVRARIPEGTFTESNLTRDNINAYLAKPEFRGNLPI